MNSCISVDLHENIVIKTDTCPTTEELLAAACEYPFLIDVINRTDFAKTSEVRRRSLWL